MNEMAENMRKARKDAGLSRPQLAELSGVHSRTIAQWEQGISSPTVTTCDLVAATLGLTIDEYIHGKVEIVKKKRR